MFVESGMWLCIRMLVMVQRRHRCLRAAATTTTVTVTAAARSTVVTSLRVPGKHVALRGDQSRYDPLIRGTALGR